MSCRLLSGQVATERRFEYVWLFTPYFARHTDIDTSALSCVGGLAYIVLIASRNPALSYVAVYVATWYVGIAYDAFGSYLSRQWYLSPNP
jgi:hypothetical protein